MSVHVCIVLDVYAGLILSGRKTVECRLTKNAVPPFGVVAPGDRVFLKRSAGAFFAVAEAGAVWMSDRLTPRCVEGIRRRHEGEICGSSEYWERKCGARFGTLIWLRDVVACEVRPDYKPQNMRAWYTLDDSADPLGKGWRGVCGEGGRSEGGDVLGKRNGVGSNGKSVKGSGEWFELEVTAGNMRQGYVRLGEMVERFPAWAIGGKTKAEAGKPIVMRLSGGRTVETDIVGPRRMLRWRGWGAWFDEVGAVAGDGLRFERIGEGEYRVRVVRRRG